MTTWPQVNHTKLIERVMDSKVGKDELSIWGGYCIEKDLLHFIQQWKQTFHFQIWEYASEIYFKKEEIPPLTLNVSLLERGRLFGRDGDLALRRDGPQFHWSFIGPAGSLAPEGNYSTRSYWNEDIDHNAKTFHQHLEKALLWGEWDGERWYDSRIAGAQLNYPQEGKRVQLEYKVFSHAGQICFVWYTGLSEWREKDRG